MVSLSISDRTGGARNFAGIGKFCARPVARDMEEVLSEDDKIKKIAEQKKIATAFFMFLRIRFMEITI